MRLLGHYPVETDQQRSRAVDYFEENAHMMTAQQRAQYAYELSPLLDESGIAPGEKLAAYLGEPCGPETALAVRRIFTSNEHHDALDGIQKMASAGASWEQLVGALADFDAITGLDKHYAKVPDPYLSMIRTEKTASVDMPDDKWHGPTDVLRRTELENWVHTPEFYELMKARFPIDLVQSMRKNPWPIFSSLPDPHKTIISRMCNDKTFAPRPAGRSMYDQAGASDREDLFYPPEQAERELTALHLTNKERVLGAIKRL